MTSHVSRCALLVLAVLYSCVDRSSGHGRMIEPAARNTMWRQNYDNPRNYNDMGLNCGGFPNQFERQGGRCGVCGDPFQGPRENEAGGKYARGVIARQYKTGSFINVTVELTSNHKGYMEFRLCPVNNPMVKATQTCLDKHLLNIIGHGTRYFIADNAYNVFIELLVMLPPRLQCSQCVLQWKWVAGQSMGPDGLGGECMGCGNQENFINCADVAIGPKAVKPLPKLRETPSNPTPTVPSPQPAYNPAPAYKPEPPYQPGPTYNVVAQEPATNNYGANPMASPSLAYNPPTVNVAPKPLETTQPSWNMDPNMMMMQMMMNGGFGQNDYMMSMPSPWNAQWQPQQQSAPVQQQQLLPPSPQNAQMSMYGMLPSFFQENTEWNTEAPPHYQQQYQPQPTHQSSHDPADYAGNEPGEYPEADSVQPNSNSGGSSSYMQGYNDALRQMQMQQGIGWNGNNPKASRAASEIALSLQEKQKQGSAPSCPGRVCKATGSWKGQANLDSWCETTCKVGQCPDHMCACTCPGSGGWGAVGGNCRALDRQKGAPMDKWCDLNCKHNNCPTELCICY